MSKDFPFFSIVVPTCDRPKYLEYSLRTILNLDYPNFEVIISDNYSGPETYQIVKTLGDDRVHYVRTEERLNIADSYQFAYQHAQGDYITILGDDDGITPSALKKLAQIFRVTGLELVTWQDYAYWRPDWPTIERNRVVNAPSIEFDLSIVSAKHLLQKVGTLDHVYSIKFPHGSRFCFSRSLGQRVQQQCGRVFDIPYPDFTSGLYFLVMLRDSYYAFYKGVIASMTVGYNANVASFLLPKRKRNLQRAKAAVDEFKAPIFIHTPLKNYMPWNGHAECVLRVLDKLKAPESVVKFNYSHYFLKNYISIMEDNLSDPFHTKVELLSEFWQVLNKQSQDIQDEFARLKDQYQRARFKSRLYSLVPFIINPNSIWMKTYQRITAKVFHKYLDTHNYIYGDNHGFTNLYELMEKIESIFREKGAVETFIKDLD